MKYTIPIALAFVSATLSYAQNSASYAQGLLQALQSANLTMLASAAGNSSDLVAALQSGGNKTVLAPTNDAFAALGATPSEDLLHAIITYHVINSTVSVADVSAAGNNVSSTLLKDDDFVSLPNDRAQVVVLSKDAGNGTVLIKEASRNVTFNLTSDGPTYDNLLVQPINTVLSIPGNLSTVASSLGYSSFADAASGAQLIQTLSDAETGLTIFVPNNDAFQAAKSEMASADRSAVQNILRNHVINGTVAYSTLLTGPNAVASVVSASGNSLTFGAGSNGGLTVTSGNVTANIIRTDVLLSNGVIHVIDSVLATTTTNPEAAASAFHSATSAAAARPSAGISGSSAGSNGAVGGAVGSVALVAAAAVAGALALMS
ncbi:FAS1 domain-containing protein [Tilletiaria anomala UBC 951]|uniref:FAS1 domain-containing protein n=1 Tax=Tilletiaria anomala (strain ATCC 24038 / CBS 436.72 / UBC 951) TaxID=1037660 RepID=A0A066WN36_TILAU|nr:FAS1 domain-containing protein [Tilletiaria anomala UBC 951]KDN52045.1 FAS1 domain-containing protein [Tilletiaria anomala UBC 951]